MHVGLNCVFLTPGASGGMEIYARALAPALAALGLEVTAFVSRDAAGAGLAEREVVLPVRASRRPQWVLGEQLLLPGAARRAGVDLLHSLASTAPVRGRGAGVVTVQDLNYLIVPEAHPGPRRLAMRVLVPAAIRAARHVVVPSESTRADVARHLGVAAERITVVAHGPGRAGGRAPALVPGARPFVVTLSAPLPHKNVDGLLRALALIPADERPLLVAPGYRTPYLAELEALAAELGVETQFPGWLPDDELDRLLASARALVFPSRYEGFGFPVVEAMARGLPVACSNAGSLAEVAGDGALLFDPADPQAIADAVRRLLADEELRERLVAAGRAQAATFSWERCARETVAVYERVLSA